MSKLESLLKQEAELKAKIKQALAIEKKAKAEAKSKHDKARREKLFSLATEAGIFALPDDVIIQGFRKMKSESGEN